MGNWVTNIKTYSDSVELISEIKLRLNRFMEEFESISDSMKDMRLEDVDKTPSEMLSYQLGWTDLLLSWEKRELAGEDVQTPSPDYKWNNLGGLYRDFYEKFGCYSLSEQSAMLEENTNRICEWIADLSHDELFVPEQRKWATTNAKWPVYKWIHINTVAPFTNFRTKIRKWKKKAEL